MSQAKVDRYRRKEEPQQDHEKTEDGASSDQDRADGIRVAIVEDGQGVSLYQNITNPSSTATAVTESYTVDASAIDDYLNSLPQD